MLFTYIATVCMYRCVHLSIKKCSYCYILYIHVCSYHNIYTIKITVMHYAYMVQFTLVKSRCNRLSVVSPIVPITSNNNSGSLLKNVNAFS